MDDPRLIPSTSLSGVPATCPQAFSPHAGQLAVVENLLLSSGLALRAAALCCKDTHAHARTHMHARTCMHTRMHAHAPRKKKKQEELKTPQALSLPRIYNKQFEKGHPGLWVPFVRTVKNSLKLLIPSASHTGTPVSGDAGGLKCHRRCPLGSPVAAGSCQKAKALFP